MHNNQRGSTLILLVILAVAIAGGLILISSKMRGNNNVEPSETLPPVDQRVNPDPQSNNTITVGELSPASTVGIEKVNIAQEGYVHVYMDIKGEPGKLLGKSKLLAAGNYENLSISLSSPLKDGDVVLIGIYSKFGVEVKDENDNPIRVQKNIGMAMGHYDPNEY